MVAELCLGKVSAVCGTGRDLALCPQQPRPAATHLVCHVDTVLIDQQTIYAPRQGNDRLLRGLKGEPQTSMSSTFCFRAHSRRYDEAPRALVVAAPSSSRRPVASFLIAACRRPSTWWLKSRGTWQRPAVADVLPRARTGLARQPQQLRRRLERPNYATMHRMNQNAISGGTVEKTQQG